MKNRKRGKFVRLNRNEYWLLCQIRRTDYRFSPTGGSLTTIRKTVSDQEFSVILTLRQFGVVRYLGLDFVIEGGRIKCPTKGTQREDYEVTFEESGEVQDPIVRQIMERYNPAELKAFANGYSDKPVVEAANIEFSGKWFKWMQISDTHIGSIYSNPEDIIAAFRHAEAEGCEMITHVGDIFEGMSSREGHVYELSHIGYSSQLDLGKRIFSQTRLPVNAISGNHDEWFIKSNGAYIVKELCDSLPNMKYLGQNYGTIYLNGARYELTHGLDGGGSYAISYRVQKIIEAYEGGQKPQILGTGHDHKSGYFFLRNVHAFLGGCMQNQSDWMRQTRKSAMKGYWIIEALIEKGEVKTIKMQFIPFYR